MIVVSDTSPITSLAAIGQLDLLNQIYGEIRIPQGVWLELSTTRRVWPGQSEVLAVDWLRRHSVSNHELVIRLQNDLDRGESEAIALALELQADVLLLDEAEGRLLAQQYNLKVTGVVGVLLTAKQMGLIGQVKPHLDALRQQAGFYLTRRLYEHALRLAQEATSA